MFGSRASTSSWGPPVLAVMIFSHFSAVSFASCFITVRISCVTVLMCLGNEPIRSM